jgi:hypothetical protein
MRVPVTSWRKGEEPKPKVKPKKPPKAKSNEVIVRVGKHSKVCASQLKDIIKGNLTGKSITKIAEETGLTRKTVHRKLMNPDVRAFIEEETRLLMNDGLVPSRKTLIRLAVEGEKSNDKEMLRLSLDASKVILGAAGITSSGSTTINNILNVTQNPDVAKELSQLSEFLASKMRPQIECIDVDGI